MQKFMYFTFVFSLATVTNQIISMNIYVVFLFTWDKVYLAPKKKFLQKPVYFVLARSDKGLNLFNFSKPFLWPRWLAERKEEHTAN